MRRSTLVKRFSLAFLFVLLASASALAAAPFPAKVVHIADGDTITVLRGREQIKIRLNGIDCPESRQPWGRKAKRFTADLVGMKTVQVQPIDKDRYGRLVAVVSLPETGQVLGLELVRAGLAWWYRRYAPKDQDLREAEERAKAARKGLWADPNPIPPWEWRRGKRIGIGRRMEVPKVGSQ